MTEADGKLSCGAVVIRKTDNGWATVMLRAYRNWDFPKGLCEDGELPLEAAIREVGEETGIGDLCFHWGEQHMETGPYNRGKVARYYLAETTQEQVVMGISPELGRPEHHEFRWVSLDDAYDLSAPRVRLVVQWARQVIGA
ncbi:MAG: NUDIX domain-containing protein [Gammaproteobacteria bacterium]|jgi:8-oxo-dGTP pyrophosphatase MutT (NUDIX family)|nr:NUDIX domain-containing protein [Gammaproteobacteria bacterium]